MAKSNDYIEDTERVNKDLRALIHSITWESRNIAGGAEEHEVNDLIEEYIKKHGEEILLNIHSSIETFSFLYFSKKLKDC
jgi:hypothetical protein